MVNGIKMVFKKDLMLNRIEKQGLMHLVGKAELEIMDNLDGQEVTTACWNRQVHDEPVFACTGKDGKVYDVNEADCVPA